VERAPSSLAVVVAFGAVFDEGSAVAAGAAAAEFGVELLEDTWGDLLNGEVAEDWADVAIEVAAVHLAGAVFEFGDAEPLFDDLGEGDTAFGGELLVDLGDEAAHDAVGLALGRTVGALNGLAEVGAPARHGVQTGVHDYPEAVSATLDAASRAAVIRQNTHSLGAYSHPRPHPKIN